MPVQRLLGNRRTGNEMLIDCIYLLCLIVLLSTSKKFANFGVEEPTTKFKPRPDDWDKYIMRDRPT